jgi:lipoprotein-anchoring transpeptidase ErfK/SrfK
VLKRAALFIVIAGGALLAAAMAHSAPSIVAFGGYRPGTIVVKTHERKLYYVVDEYRALRFPVGVGRSGMTWTGRAYVEGKYIEPAWEAPPDIKGDYKGLPEVIPGGARNNPMGAAALTLRGGKYAIHGTNNPSSVGRFVSHGCIRMYNRDIRQLYRLVWIGTPVFVEP